MLAFPLISVSFYHISTCVSSKEMTKIQLGDGASPSAVAAAAEAAADSMLPSFGDDDDDDGIDIHDEFEYESFGGFSEDDVLELAAQGIKPTDPEARDVLQMLKDAGHEARAAGGDY